MEQAQFSEKNRELSIEDFLNDIKDYSKKDLIFVQELTSRAYGPPPYDKNYVKSNIIVSNLQHFNSRLILLRDYLVYLTLWTPENKGSKKLFASWFLKGVTLGSVSQYLAHSTFGITYVLESLGKSFLSSRKLLGKNPIQELINPYSAIIPLKCMNYIEIISWGWRDLGKVIHTKADLPYEDTKEWYFTLGNHHKSDEWVSKINELLNR